MSAFGANLIEVFRPRPSSRVTPSLQRPLAATARADIFITTPAFHKGKLIGFSVNTIHHVDIGGRKARSVGRGLRGRPIARCCVRYVLLNEMLFDLIRRNVRYSEKMIDLRAQVATGWAGCGWAVSARSSISRPPRGLGRWHTGARRGYSRRSPRAADASGAKR